MTNAQLEVEKQKVYVAERQLALTYAKREREAKGAELRASFECDIMDLDRKVEEKELALQRQKLYLQHAQAESDRGFEV